MSKSWGSTAWLVLVALLHACTAGDQDDGAAPPPAVGGDGGSARPGGGLIAPAAGSGSGEGTSTAGDRGDGRGGLGGGGGGPDNVAGTHASAGGYDAASGGGAESGGQSGGGSDLPPEPELPLNGCLQFVDGTAPSAVRLIDWGYGVGFEPERCMKIGVGQTVTWTGQLPAHPLQPAGGTTPSPILASYGAEATEHAVTFPAPGLFGYVCGQHSGMQGAIWVE